MSVELAVQEALRARLVATPAVTALVPADSIIDRHARPAPSPAIILGESQLVDEGTSLRRAHSRVFHTVHVWKKEPSLEGMKVICGAIRTAVNTGRFDMAAGFQCADARVSMIRHLRDPDGETSHGVVTVEVLVSEVPA